MHLGFESRDIRMKTPSELPDRGLSESRQFIDDFEAGRITPADFGHRAHVRLAYAFLCHCEPSEALQRFRTALSQFLLRNTIPASKYHETVTQAWMHLVAAARGEASSEIPTEAFFQAHPELLDSKLLGRFYSEECLASDPAKREFVPPDKAPLPSRGR